MAVEPSERSLAATNIQAQSGKMASVVQINATT